MRKIANLVLLSFLLIPVYAEEELNCIEDKDGAVYQLVGADFQSAYNVNAPIRGRHELNYEGDETINVRTLNQGNYHNSGSVYSFISRGWWRPVIRVEVEHGDWYTEYYNDEEGRTLKTKPELEKKLKEAIARIPHLVLNSLPPTMILQIGSGGNFFTEWLDEEDNRVYFVAIDGESHFRNPYALRGPVLESYLGKPSTGNLEQVLLHELAHVIDFHYDVTIQDEFWEEVHNKPRNEFVTGYAGTNPVENFAESMVSWFSMQANYKREIYSHYLYKDDEDLGYEWADIECTLKDYIRQKAPEEMSWWDRKVLEASESVSGRLFSK